MVRKRTPRTHCLRGHLLEGDNINPPEFARRGVRECLSCLKARKLVRKSPELTRDDLQVISDEFYAEIMDEPALVIESKIEPVIETEPEVVTEPEVEPEPEPEDIEEGLPSISQNPADVAIIPFHGDSVQSVEVDGEPYVVFRPLVETLGLDFRSQSRRLAGKSWAGMVKMTIPSGGGPQEMTAINLKTLTMWLATVNENRVNEASRPLVVAYQNEVAEAIESYWTKGTATNPRVTESQPQDFSETISVSKQQLELLKMAEGLIDPDHLRAKANVVLARGLGEAPQLDPVSRPLYVHDFLKGLGLNGSEIKSDASNFGKKLKEAYVEEFGVEPQKYPQTLPNNQTRDVYAYTERDRPFMERVWAEKQEEKRKKEGRS